MKLWGAVPGSPIIFKEELQAACKTADYIGLSVAFHCHDFEEIKMCIRCGVRTVERFIFMDSVCIRIYQETERSFPILILSLLLNFVEHTEGKPKHYAEKSKEMKDKMIEGLKTLRKINVKIGWSADAQVYTGSHRNRLYEFQARVNRVGFTPLECLVQATKNNAKILNISETVDTIACGKKQTQLLWMEILMKILRY